MHQGWYVRCSVLLNIIISALGPETPLRSLAQHQSSVQSLVDYQG